MFEIDRCQKCGGVWFDEGEFRAAVKRIADFPVPSKYQLLDVDPHKISEQASKNPLYSRRLHCPKDREEMKVFEYDGNSGILIDRCEKCESIWLDGIEIAKVKEHLAPKPLHEVLVRFFAAMREQKRQEKEDAEALRALPFFLFAPAFFVPMGDGRNVSSFPFVTVLLIFLAAVLNWRIPLRGFDGFVPFATIILFFWVFGKRLEEYFGRDLYVFLCALSSLVGGIVALLLGGIPIGHSPITAMASMASGCMGAYLVRFPREKLTFFIRGQKALIPAWVYLLGWFAFQFAGYQTETTMGIGFASNIAGFLFGALFIFVFSLYGKRMDFSETPS